MPDALLWAVPADVAFVVNDARVAMIRPDRPDQPPVILEDSGAALWTTLKQRDAPVSAAELAAEVGVPADAVQAFLEGLNELGCVERV